MERICFIAPYKELADLGVQANKILGSNIQISPLNAFLPIIIGFLQKYKKDAGVGTVIAYELPYAIWFLGTWIILFIVWYLLGLPLGPGASITL